MFKSTKKTLLLTSGCSYTNRTYGSDPGCMLFWPELLGGIMKVDKIVNLGRGGSGNEYIISSIMDYVETVDRKKYKIIIVVMWSETQRVDFECLDGWMSSHVYRSSSRKGPIAGDGLRDSLWELKYNPEGQLKKSLRIFNSFFAHMHYNELEHYCIQGPQASYDTYTPIHGDIDFDDNIPTRRNKIICNAAKISIEYIIKNNIEFKSFEPFIGWPMFKDIGGFCADDIVDDNDKGKRGRNAILRVSNEDSHPNLAGHRVIAEHILKEMKKYESMHKYTY